VIFYFNRETGQRVSKSTWTRSKAQGGSRYVRRSIEERSEGRKNSRAKQGKENDKERIHPAHTGTPSQAPRTYQEWQEAAQKKFKKRIQQDDFDYDDGIEYETGVDY